MLSGTPDGKVNHGCLFVSIYIILYKEIIMANSNSLQMFSNPLFNVRIVIRDNKPWFVAKDVAECIGHSNVTKMCELCKGKDKTVIGMGEFETNGLLVSNMVRELTCVSESGLYRILGKCNLPKCEQFEEIGRAHV